MGTCARGEAQEGSEAIRHEDAAKEFTLTNSVVRGEETSTKPFAEHDLIYNCGECLKYGPWIMRGSYVLANGMEGTNEHYEAVFGKIQGRMGG